MKITESIVDIKGRQNYLEIYLNEEADFALLRSAMIHKLRSAGDFFIGAERAVVIGSFEKHQQELIEKILKEDFSFLQIDFQEQKTMEEASCAEQLREAEAKNNAKMAVEQQEETELLSLVGQEGRSIFIQSTIRNGQRIDYEGHILLHGDVNRGGELVATGNIIVMGALKGRVHAGSAGDENASVMALEFLPQQLRIASSLAIPPENDMALMVPEIAHICNGEIAIEPLMKEAKKKKKGFWKLIKNS